MKKNTRVAVAVERGPILWTTRTQRKLAAHGEPICTNAVFYAPHGSCGYMKRTLHLNQQTKGYS